MNHVSFFSGFGFVTGVPIGSHQGLFCQSAPFRNNLSRVQKHIFIDFLLQECFLNLERLLLFLLRGLKKVHYYHFLLSKSLWSIDESDLSLNPSRKFPHSAKKLKWSLYKRAGLCLIFVVRSSVICAVLKPFKKTVIQTLLFFSHREKQAPFSLCSQNNQGSTLTIIKLNWPKVKVCKYVALLDLSHTLRNKIYPALFLSQ